MGKVGMLVDTTVCTGCRGCQVACKQWWDLPAEATENHGSYENPRDLSPTTWTRVTFHELDDGGRVRWFQMAWGCLHCTEAACVDVCPTRALAHHPLGMVTLDRERCNGCGYCAIACPFDVPRLETHRLTGRGKASKCNMCQDRVTNGLVPACAKTCPSGAIRFGDRDKLAALGRERVALLKADGLADANIYGADMLGGLGRMFVLGARPAAYRLPDSPRYPLAVRLWQRVAQPFGQVAIAATLVGIVVNWIATFRLRGKPREEV